MAVSVERTNSIKNFLMKNGIPESQIKRSPSAIIFNPELSKIPYIEIKMLKKQLTHVILYGKSRMSL